jgi:hypothetical protein
VLLFYAAQARVSMVPYTSLQCTRQEAYADLHWGRGGNKECGGADSS